MIEPGSIVLVHLSDPSEKFWGVIDDMGTLGVRFRAVSVSTFDDWVTEIATAETPSLGLADMFVPMSRVERIFLDEQVGAVESYRQRFQRRVGSSVEGFLGLEDLTGES